MNTKRKYLLIELILIFIGIPVFLIVYQTPLLKLSILITGTLVVLFYFYKSRTGIKKYLNFQKFLHTYYIIKVVSVCIIILVTGFYLRKEFFLALPYRPVLIPLIIIGYPLISVLPQELIYRLFFYERYGILFQNKPASVLINGALFAFMHIIYGNPIAVMFTFIGGILLSNTYLKTRSLLLTVIEHSVYGYFVFLSGYGQHFLSENIFRLLLSHR